MQDFSITEDLKIIGNSARVNKNMEKVKYKKSWTKTLRLSERVLDESCNSSPADLYILTNCVWVVNCSSFISKLRKKGVEP